jgi:hypothetical protein
MTRLRGTRPLVVALPVVGSSRVAPVHAVVRGLPPAVRLTPTGCAAS